jgi:hypothetical protein
LTKIWIVSSLSYEEAEESEEMLFERLERMVTVCGAAAVRWVRRGLLSCC